MFETKPPFLDLSFDHSTLLLSPTEYRVFYAVFRILFGGDVVYHVLSQDGKRSMTYALRIGKDKPDEDSSIKNTLFAVVEPSEPKDESSHVRTMLASHRTPALWQHLALRTPDLFLLHEYMSKRGVNFITPILEDKKEDLLQVFTGELFSPESEPSAVFFEFVQRRVTDDMRARLAKRDRETFFRDETFLGLYGIKEKEYQSGQIVPIIDDYLFRRLELALSSDVKDFSDEDMHVAEQVMLAYGRGRQRPRQKIK